MASAERTRQLLLLHRLITRQLLQLQPGRFLFTRVRCLYRSSLLGHSSGLHVVSAGPGDFATAAAATAATAARATLHTARSFASRYHSFSTTAAAPEAAPADAAAAAAASDAAQHTAAPDPSTAAAAGGVLQTSCKVAGRIWTFETGRLAGLAHGSCVVTVEGTSVLGTAVVDPTPQLEADGVPLQVDYRERLSAVGRLPLRPDRRERVGSERELLVARLVDRALRPLLPPGFLYDTQVHVQLLSADGGIDPEVVAINAASAALLLARNIPFTHPVGAVKVRRVRREGRGHRLIVNTAVDALYDSSSSSIRATHKTTSSSSSSSSSSIQAKLGLVYAGTPYKATAIEAAGQPTSEDAFVAALQLAAISTQPLIVAQQQLAAAAAAAADGQQQQQQHLPLLWPDSRVQQVVADLAGGPLRALFSREQQQQQQESSGSSSVTGSNGSSVTSSGSSDKKSRAAALAGLQAELLRDLQRLGLLAETPAAAAAAAAAAAGAGGMFCREDVLRAFDVLQSRVMREVLLNSQEPRRVDGRLTNELRPISCEAGPLPRNVHGSALFSRGETQCLAAATVGHDTDVAPEEGLWRRRGRSPLHLHYSFPPFSVGEVGKTGPPNRREVGHGNLARAGVAGVMPSVDEFPFCVRVTADTLSSSGSSSMAAVCAASLALRTAGVPTAGLAAGISVGLVTQTPPQLGTPHLTQQGTGTAAGAAAVDVAGDAAGDAGASDAGAAATAAAAAAGQQQQGGGQGVTEPSVSSVGYIDPSSYSSFVATVMSLSQQQQQVDGAESFPSSAEASSSSSSSDSEGSSSDSSSSSSGSSDDDNYAAASSSTSSGGLLSSSYGGALLLTDIQGIEDHLGDMDFKVAGTAGGITAVQLDTKLPGIDLHLLEAALLPAAEARAKLLAAMEGALQTFASSHSPLDLAQFGSTQIMKELVPRLIGPQGSTLTELEEGCGASLIVDDTGTINVYAPTQMRYQHALAAIQEVEGRGVVKGEVYRVRVLKVVDFGAYVTLPNGMPAMLHISELSHEKIREVRDVISEGQEFDVVCKGRDSKGFVQLSLKAMQAGPDDEGQEGAQHSRDAAEGRQGSTLVAAAAAAAGAGSAQGRLASAMAAISSGGSSSIGRASQQHHVHRPSGGAGSSSSRPKQLPRAMTWRPPPEQQEQQQRQQKQGPHESGKAEEP